MAIKCARPGDDWGDNNDDRDDDDQDDDKDDDKVEPQDDHNFQVDSFISKNKIICWFTSEGNS